MQGSEDPGNGSLSSSAVKSNGKGKARLIDIQKQVKNPIIDLPTGSDEDDPEDLSEITTSLMRHVGVSCDGPLCEEKYGLMCIEGVRYKCQVCPDKDFCLECLLDPRNQHDVSHPLLKCIRRSAFVDVSGMKEEEKEDLVASLQAKNTNVRDVRGLLGRVLPLDGSAMTPFSSEASESITRGLNDIDLSLLSPDEEQSPSCRPPGVVELNQPEGDDWVAYYKVVENGTVTVEFRPPGPSPRKPDREEVVAHSQDADVLVDVMSGKIKRYQYPSRDQFYEDAWAGRPATRLVDLLPGQFEDKLECVLRPVRLMEKPAYEALSYTWKETAFERANSSTWNKETDQAFRSVLDLKHPVYCDGQYLQINTGLRDALRRLRDPDEIKTYWIDQLCVNQQDLGERAFQVQAMRLIYNRAKRVVVWTGDEDEHTTSAFDMIRKLAPRCAVPESALPTLDELSSDQRLDLPGMHSQAWISLMEFFKRPVFQRVWVIQEIALAQNLVVRCGEFELEWWQLAKVANLLCQGPWLSILPRTLSPDGSISRPDFALTISKIRNDFQDSKEASLEILLSATRYFQASDPRDKVYAVLGLRGVNADKTSPCQIVPDYEKSIVDVFTEATKHVLEHEMSLDICSMVADSVAERLPGLPSWVPDFNSQPETVALGTRDPLNSYRAAGDSTVLAVWPFEDCPDLFATSSYRVDNIVLVGDCEFRKSSPNIHQTLLAWSHLAASLGDEYRTGESTLSAFWRTCVGDSALVWRAYPAPESYFRAFALYFLSGLEGIADEDPVLFEKYMNPLVSEMAEAVLPEDVKGEEVILDGGDQQAVMKLVTTCGNRKMFLTEGGYLGLAPFDARAGDEIHILSGARTPFVLRKGEARASEYESEDTPSAMVGEVYVNGLMDGQALEQEGFEWNEILVR